MVHEPFHRHGLATFPEFGLYIGWVTMAEAYSDCLPIWNETRDICLLFEGEHFHDVSDVDLLAAKGHRFDPANATSLVHLYEEFGVHFLEKLNGPFCGAIVDLRSKIVTLFNDRYGLNRVYIHEQVGSFHFASEAKALLRILPGSRSLDPRGLGEFFSCGCPLQNRTLFAGIELLPPASSWELPPDGRPIKRCYFAAEQWSKLPTLDLESYYQRLRKTWARVLPRYLRDSNRTALSLTGGVDSRLILAWAETSPGSLPCYTWGGKYRDCADVTLSRRLAALCGQTHETITLDRAFLDAFPGESARTVFLSDGAMDVAGAVDLFVQPRARQIAPIRLSGVYGGEMLRSLIAFKPTSFHSEILDPEVANSVHRAATTYECELRQGKMSFIAFKQTPWHMTAKFSIERIGLTFRTPYFDNELVALAFQAPHPEGDSLQLPLRMIAEKMPKLEHLPTDRDVILGKASPFSRARHITQQFLFKAEYAYDYGMPDWLARADNVFSSLHLERLFLGRHKFHHFRIWYRNELASHVKDVLLDPVTLQRPIYNRSALENVVHGHTSGKINRTTEIHKLLTCELIHRELLHDRR